MSAYVDYEYQEDTIEMNTEQLTELFTSETLDTLFPPERADQFFDALFGDASEGAFDISLGYRHNASDTGKLRFELQLRERSGKCLACNLTYGLPEVFTRHPVLNINGLVQEIEQLLGDEAQCTGWKLGSTETVSNSLHVIPLTISVQ